MNGILFYSTFLLFKKGSLGLPTFFLSPYNNTLVSAFISSTLHPLLISFAFLYAASPAALPILHPGHVLCTVCTVCR